MKMPKPDAEVIARRKQIVGALRDIVPGEGVIDEVDELRAYECDGLTAYRELPLIVVLPTTVEQVSRVLAYCHASGIKVVPRGAGTTLIPTGVARYSEGGERRLNKSQRRFDPEGRSTR